MSSIIAEVPREKLKELIEKNGEALLQDPDRCEGLLKDHCGAHRREISALVGALEERIPLELKSSWQTAMTPEAMRARLVQRLEENRGLAPDVATWAVDAWSYALGVGLGRTSDRVEDGVPVAGVAGVAAAGAATTGSSNLSVAERIASDRAGASNAALDGATKTSGLAGMATQKKAGIGAVAALVIAAGAFALIHHPTPPPPGPGPSGGGNGSVNGGNNGGNNGGTKPDAGKGPAGAGAGSDVSDNSGGGNAGNGGGGSAAGGNGGGAVATSVPTLPVGTSVSVRLDRAADSDSLNNGDLLDATVSSPVTADGNVIIATGARAHVRVSGIDRDGKTQHMQLALADVVSEQGRMRIASSSRQFDGTAAKADVAKRAGIGGAVGAAGGFVVGHLFHHGGAGAAAGAGAGAVTGAVTAKGGPVKLSAETLIHFSLTQPAKAQK